MKRLYSPNQAASRLFGLGSVVASRLTAARFKVTFSYWLLVLLVAGLGSVSAVAAPPADDCSFQTYTQSQSGYGTNSNGNGLPAYMEAHFPAAFPGGLTVGCAGGHTLKLTSTAAIAEFLPSTGTTQALSANYTNPTKPKGNGKKEDASAYANTFAGEVVALTLSVGFDLTDANFSSATTRLKDAVITSGTFTGKTVGFVLDQANLALGGCTSQYSLSELNTIVTTINAAYEGKKGSTLLSCPPPCNVSLPVVTSVTYCQGAAANSLSSSVTAISGATVQLYTSATGGTPLASSVQPSTATVGSTTYYASQVVGSCESGRAPLTVTINASPSNPGVTTPLTYCQGAAANLLSSSVTLASGASLRLYTSATGGTPLASDFRPSTAAAGSTTYYVSQIVGSCESGRTPLTVTITNQATSPTVSTPLTYCLGAAANLLNSSVTTTSGATLRLYTTATGGTPLATDFRPSTATAGSTTYYAAQVVGSCESGRVPLVVTVTTGLPNPSVTTSLAYCQGAAANLLSSSVTVTNGATVQLYASATGGTPLASDFRPSTATAGSTTYYASQALGGCESGRTPIVVAIGTQGAPTVASSVTYCQGAATNPLSSSVTLSGGASLRLYANATDTTPLPNDFQPSTATLGTTTYYVSQTTGSCESSRVPLKVTVTNGPAAPAVVTPLTYCVGATANALSSSVTLSSGASVQLYTSATGGTPLAAGFQPSTATVGSTTYYASQALGGCESSRTPVVVNVVTAPGAPTIVSSLVIDNQNIAAWGDSFTDANYGLYPQVLSQLSGRNVVNLGIGAQTSVDIKNRMVADVQKHTWPSIIWSGRNDSGNPAQVEASIATMVANLTHTDYLVLSVFNGAGEGIGTAAYDQIMALNRDLATIYGSHYLDVRSYIVSQYDPSNPQDVSDHNADIPPSSLRQDFLHPNAQGSTLIAKYIYAHFDQLLSGGVVVRYCQGAQAAALSTAFNAPASGTDLRFYTSASDNTLQGTGSSFAPSTSTVGNTTYYVAQAAGTCESGRTPITVSVTNCTTSTAAAQSARATLTSSSAAMVTPNTASTDAAPTFAVYPNPFTEQATVDFSLPAGQAYTLELYNGTGQLVRHLAAGTAGVSQRYQYPIAGQELRSGLYVVRLTAGQASRTLRLTLSK